MDRVVFIIRPDRLDLFDALARAFAGEVRVEVILERRVGPRRKGDVGHPAERRRWDRRRRPRVNRDIRERGWSVVRIPE